jgi:anti-sigma-K factor RskA
MAHNERFEELVALQAMGLPLGEEASELARHLDEGCETCERLLAEFRVAATALSVEAPPRRPRPEVREKILASLRPARRPAAAAAPSWTSWLLGLAALVVFGILINDDMRLRRQREELRSQNLQMAESLDSARRDLARRDLYVRVLQSDDVKVLSLGGKDPQPSARARVFWSEQAKRGILLAGNLAPLSPDKQYELWVFDKGKPVPAGVFDSDASGRAVMESPDLSAITSAQNFAVTIEPRGGMPQPTGPIVLIGT